MKTSEAYFHILFFEILDFYGPEVRRTLSAEKLYVRILRCIRHYLSFLKAFVIHLFKSTPHSEVLAKDYWFFINTKNQRDCLLPIKTQFSSSVFIGTGYQQTGEKIRTLPMGKRWIYSHRFLCILRYIWKRKPAYAIRYLDFLMMTMGMYECFSEYLKTYRPKAIVLASDLSYEQRSLLFAAKNLGIPTIYVQHASVSTIFPPLEFDLNLLEGEDTFNKYKLCGPVNGAVRFIGMPKFDGFEQKRNKKNKVENVGICCGPLDDYDKIVEIVHKVVKALPNLSFTFRKHPGDKRTFDFPALQNQLAFSDPLKEKALDFLANQDLILAGNSSIHLEAVLLNLESVYFPIDGREDLDDYYGFARNGLTNRVYNIGEIIEILTKKHYKKEDVYLRAKYYNHLIDTPYEGKSALLAAEYIRALANEGKILDDLTAGIRHMNVKSSERK